MVARGQLGDHPAVQGVQVDLAEQMMGQQPVFGVENSHSGLITTGFNA